VGIHVPSASVAPLGSGEAYAAFFRQVEALGLDAVWTEDRIFHPANMLDSLTLLAWAAANTRRIRVGTAVMVLNLRHAAVVARQASTLSHMLPYRQPELLPEPLDPVEEHPGDIAPVTRLPGAGIPKRRDLILETCA
jgi:hypothetical protein